MKIFYVEFDHAKFAIKSLLACIFMTFSVSGFAAPGPEADNGRQSITPDTARHCKDIANPERAVKACSRLLAFAGTNQKLKALILVDRANANARLRQYEPALRDLNAAIKIEPNLYQAYFYRGSLNSRMGNHASAVANYTRTIRLKPDLFVAYFNRGTAFGRLGNIEKSISDFTKAISLKPNIATAYANRGTAFAKLEKNTKALADYSEALRLNPKFATVYFNRGAIYRKLGQVDAALADYLSAFQLKGPKRIKALQKNLSENNHFPGEIDGRLSLQTKQALKSCLNIHRKGEHAL